MTLSINLYHEVLRTKKQEQYDPLKLSIIGLIVIAIGLLGWYFVELGRKSSAVGSYRSKQAEFGKLEPLEKQAKLRETELTKQLAVTEKLGKRIEERFYWAPVLQEITLSVPETVQTTKVVADVTGDPLRKIQMTIEGVAAGDEPRSVAEEFRTALVERLGKKFKNVVSSYKTLDDNTDPLIVGGKPLRVATFSIAITFNSGSEPPPPPTQRSPRVRKTGAPKDL
jgi:hypothetical protein